MVTGATSLGLVRSELFATIEQAEQSLEQFIADRLNVSLLQQAVEYLQQIQDYDITFGIGPAGTGKPYLAVASAIDAMSRDRVKRIILVRPAVEAGERLGFLPGDLQAKINPYLRPLLDALREMMDHELIKRYTEEDLIDTAWMQRLRRIHQL